MILYTIVYYQFRLQGILQEQQRGPATTPYHPGAVDNLKVNDNQLRHKDHGKHGPTGIEDACKEKLNAVRFSLSEDEGRVRRVMSMTQY
jgi:hypothetical protein